MPIPSRLISRELAGCARGVCGTCRPMHSWVTPGIQILDRDTGGFPAEMRLKGVPGEWGAAGGNAEEVRHAVLPAQEIGAHHGSHCHAEGGRQGVDAAWFEQVTTIWALVVLVLKAGHWVRADFRAKSFEEQTPGLMR